MTKSTANRRTRKPADRPDKPYPAFPLTPHPSGAWQKKIRGRIHYFGRWARRANGKLVRLPGDGWKEALDAYKAVADDLHAGRTPRTTEGELTIKGLCNRFLTAKKLKLDAGEITARTFAEYKETTDRIVGQFGAGRVVDDLASDDFEALRSDMAKSWGPVRLGNAITRTKGVFKYAFDNALIDRPVRFGTEFRKPGKAVLRRNRAKATKKAFEAAEIKKLLDAATPDLEAMVLLGVNCGFGNTDVATLPESAVDLERGWVDFPRPKTGIERRCPLWPETVAALRVAIETRPAPKQSEAEGLVFVTARGRRWISGHAAHPVTVSIGRLMRNAGVHRPGLGFYTFRHVFRTIADGARDQVAANLIMGHSDPSMAAVYREHVEDARLQAVTEHVRAWLYETPKTAVKPR